MTSVPLIDIIGAAGAALTTLCWLPQALKVIREKRDARAVAAGDRGVHRRRRALADLRPCHRRLAGKEAPPIRPAESEAAATSPAWHTIPVDSGEAAPTCLRSTSKSSVTGCGSAMATGL